MVKAAGPPDPRPRRLRGGKTGKAKQLLKELNALLESEEIPPSEVLQLVKAKGKGRRGRPPLDEAARESVLITVRLTEEQRENLRRLAARHGEGVSAFIRHLINQALRR